MVGLRCVDERAEQVADHDWAYRKGTALLRSKPRDQSWLATVQLLTARTSREGGRPARATPLSSSGGAPVKDTVL
jgi:hypothetical protein